MDSLAERIKLPDHLAKHHYNKEFRGQIDWCVRSIYTNSLGWFDGRPDRLYTHPVNEVAKREVSLMGGPDKVMDLADKAFEGGDERWSIHLLVKLKDSGIESKELNEKLARSYEGLGRKTCNFDGRAYLLESAYELRKGAPEKKQAKINEEMALGMPLEQMFNVMATRLNPEKAMDVHQSVSFVFPDENKRFIVTIRRGIAEIVAGDPLPGTPAPVATLTVDSKTYRKMALKMISPVAAITSGKLKVSGSWVGFLSFFRKFQQ
jgi:alkyl sulfatase BDS1-like metallo-beta-lactamase superfamily hydrolase